MRAGVSLFGFRVLSEKDLSEYRCRAVRLVHEATGCEVLNLDSEDRENSFAFCFTTPPRDDTGVTHIAEHSVLSGSKRFPLKEPFSALLKGSMHTFLNAFTFPDRTVYPAASLNHADYFNLMLVYGDAVFFPLLRKETFQQEAWRLERAQSDGRMSYSGIVYNEMKGAYSSPESVVGEWAYRSLFPDTPYRFDSGGDPTVIPSLSVEDLRAYHGLHYHPSNCRIFLYGDIPMEEKLEYIQRSFLEGFGRGKRADALPIQKRWDAPRRLEKTFPIRPGSPTEKRATICMSWLSLPVTDPLGLLALEVLTEILIGSAGSPLRKRLVDSGLGEDLSPVSGLETELRETVFCAGLRGTEPESEDEIRRLVLDILSSLVEEGIDAGIIESMMHRVEFRNREISSGGSPYSLRLMRRALRGWIHGMDPVESLAFSPVMDELRAALTREKRYFENIIERELLTNPHGVTLIVTPDPHQEESESAELAARLASLSSRMSDEEKRRILADQEAFSLFQKRAESEEELARVPALTRKDLPVDVEKIPTVDASVCGTVPLLLHDVFTNGISYVDFFLPLDGLSEDLAIFLPIFCRAVSGCGSPGMTYAETAIELFRLTGGFHASLDASGIAGKSAGVGQYAFFRVKTLRQNLRPALDLILRLLTAADFEDRARVRDIVLEMRNDQKSALIPGGHHFAALRAASRMCPSAEREEKWRGIEQLLFLENLALAIDERIGEVSQRLGRIRDALIGRQGLIVNVTAPREDFAEIGAAVEEMCRGLPEGRAAAPGPKSAVDAGHPPFSSAASGGESLVTSASVGYVARAIEGFTYEDERSGSQAVLGHLLSTGYLWESVRMEGGAYGVGSYSRSMDGVFIFTSYRDPRIVRTLDAFREALRSAAEGKMDEKEIERAVVGTVGKEERPMDPSEKGFVAAQRRLYGITDEMRSSRRSLVLSADRRSVSAAAAALLASFEKGYSVVMSNRAAVEEAGRERAELATKVVAIPE